jgi:uncharacterized protein
MMPLEEQFSGRRYINLESYNKNGNPKRTPVQSIEENGLIYLRTDPKTWKVKRIASNSHVRIVLSDRSGRPLGSWVDADASIVQDKIEQERVQSGFRKQYGTIGSWIVDFIARLRGERLTTIISIKLRRNSLAD